jgi:hypothetical protein
VFETGHAGEKHAAEQEVDGGPELGCAEAEGGVVHPAHVFGELDADDGCDGLEDDEEDVEVAVDEVVVAVRSSCLL